MPRKQLFQLKNVTYKAEKETILPYLGLRGLKIAINRSNQRILKYDKGPVFFYSNGHGSIRPETPRLTV